MKKIILFVLAVNFIVGLAMVSCESTNNEQTTNTEKVASPKVDETRKAAIADSIAKAKQKNDSIAKQKNDSIINVAKGKVVVKSDEFSDRVWVEPKSAPKYRNRNGIYCYFAMENNKPTDNFRFVFQYYAEDWLFIRSIIFNIDGENITIYPNMETDCGGGYIWEWFDENYSYDLELIQKIANAKSVKMKLNGRQYYDTRTLTSTQINDIKLIYEYYKALGGKFKK